MGYQLSYGTGGTRNLDFGEIDQERALACLEHYPALPERKRTRFRFTRVQSFKAESS